MSVATWSLPDGSSRLDRATLRAMQRWHGGLRDAGRAMMVVAVAVAAFSGSGGLFHSGSGPIGSTTAGLVGIALPAGWLVHRRRHPVALPVHVRSRVIGGFLGVLLAVVLRGPVMVMLLTLDYGSSGVVSTMIRLGEATVLYLLGTWIADRRLRHLGPA